VYDPVCRELAGSILPGLSMPTGVSAPTRPCRDLSNDRRYLHPLHDVSTARHMGDQHDRCGLDGSAHRGGHQADLSKSYRASFYCCLPGARLDNPSGESTHARFGRCLDGGLDRSWRRPLFHWGWFSPLAGGCRSSRQYGTASCWWRRAATTQLFCMVWCWPDHEHCLATISKREAADRHEGLAERDWRSAIWVCGRCLFRSGGPTVVGCGSQDLL